MRTLRVRMPALTTPIVVGRGGLSRLGTLLVPRLSSRRTLLVHDAAIPDTTVREATASLRRRGFAVVIHALRSTEQQKNLRSISELYTVFRRQHLERHDAIISLGGGVTGDMVGFAAATYLRGLPFVQCPTTLLSMTDASIGGKVGVNLSEGKNLVGSFCAPRLIVLDPSLLDTLPNDELSNGLAECVKHAVINSPGAFRWTERNAGKIMSRDKKVLDQLVLKNAAFKAKLVSHDPFERGDRAFLNLGHTFAHAIEVTKGYGGMSHGQAVSVGLVAALHVSFFTGRCSYTTMQRVLNVLSACHLPLMASLPSVEKLMHAMRVDKKVEGGQLSLILVHRFGVVERVFGVSSSIIRDAWLRVGARRH